MAIWIETEICNGCGRCLRACPYDAVELVEGKAVFTERCTQCGSCVDACRDEAILSDAAERPIPDFSDHSGVWVLAEQDHGRLLPVSLELLGRASSLAADLGEEVGAILIGDGDDVSGLAEDLITHGADVVHRVTGSGLADYLTRPYTTALAGIVEAGKPSILLVGATLQGRDLAPRLARRLGLGLTADCTELDIDPDEKLLRQTRPAFGGNVMATIICRFSRPQMASVRPGIMEALASDSGRQGRIIDHAPEERAEDLGAVILRTMASGAKKVDLTQSRVVVAGGRGVGSAEGFALLEELAALMGGEVGGTRVAMEEGWIPLDRQIGQTGITVRPELYIACGVSGAIQHRAGCLDSRYIVAINRDPSASIFDVADYGLVGDLQAIVPALIETLKQHSGARMEGAE